jgi:hypothetical protein
MRSTIPTIEAQAVQELWLQHHDIIQSNLACDY